MDSTIYSLSKMVHFLLALSLLFVYLGSYNDSMLAIAHVHLFVIRHIR